jgi:hypothetical protein
MANIANTGTWELEQRHAGHLTLEPPFQTLTLDLTKRTGSYGSAGKMAPISRLTILSLDKIGGYCTFRGKSLRFEAEGNADETLRIEFQEPGYNRAFVARPHARLAEPDFKKQCLEEAHKFLKWMDVHSFASNSGHYLAGKLLEQYLHGAPTAGLTVQLGREIQRSKLHAQLGKALTEAVQKQFKNAALSQDQLKGFTRQFVAEYRARRPYDSTFHSDDNDLQVVIGGLHGIEVGQVEVGANGKFKIELIYVDVYDFDNMRGGTYDEIRKHWAELLRRKDFESFWAEYEEAWSSAPWHSYESAITGSRRLEKGLVVACFMYAIEKAGYTCGGIPWRASAWVDSDDPESTASRFSPASVTVPTFIR